MPTRDTRTFPRLPTRCARLFSALFLLACAPVRGQNADVAEAAWLFPGVSYKPSQRVLHVVQAGENHYLAARAFYAQSFIRVSDAITLNPAYLYLWPGSGQGALQKQHTLMNAAIVNFSLGKVTLDDRNLVWNWFRAHGDDLYFYRNRLRATIPLAAGRKTFKVYVFDEATYLFNSGRWTRNRIALGAAYDVFRAVNVEVFHARQTDAFTGRLNLFFIMLTVQIAPSQQRAR